MKGANDKIVLALVGASSRGYIIISNILQLAVNAHVKYVCDVDDVRGGKIVEDVNKLQGFAPQKVTDMRTVFDDKDVNTVVIATPDHWHALATVWACRAGKDVFVEKSICLTLEEGYAMAKATAENQVIVQCGSQNRSGDYAFLARDYIASGKLGKIVTVKSYCMTPDTRGWIMKPDSPVPEGLNWDLWLGPTESVPYNVSRHKGWMDWWAYSTGTQMNDAIHVIDLARMVLGDPVPRTVYSAGGRVIFDDSRDIPDNQTVVYDMGEYPFSLEASQYGDYLSKTPNSIRFSEQFPVWNTNSTRIEIYGTRGFMYLGIMGGGWQVYGEDMKLIAEKTGYLPDEAHYRNFIECIRSRKTPNAPIDQGILSSAMINLANLSYRSGKKMLRFDVETGSILDNPEAAALDKRTYRKGFEL